MTNMNPEMMSDPILWQVALTMENGTNIIKELDSTADLDCVQEIYNEVLTFTADQAVLLLTMEKNLKLSRQYEKEQAEIEQLAVVLEREIETQAGQVSDVNEFLKLVDKYLDIPELNAAILNELVSRIVVHSPVKENGRKHVQIDLYFTYVGQIRIPLKIGRESLNESEPA